MAFENLNVKLAAKTGEFIAGIEAARDRAEELGDGLGELSRKASRADDGIEEAGDEATTTAGKFAVLSAGTQGLILSFGVLTGSVATLTIAFTGLLAVLAPLGAALGALGIVGASIGLTGFAGVALAATQRTSELKRELRLIVQELTNAFAPVTTEAAAVLTTLAKRFRSIIPELVPGRMEIAKIGDAFTKLGSNIIRALPPLVDAATQLTAKFLPGVADASGGVEGLARNIRDLVTSQKFSNFISNITTAAKELVPELSQIATNLSSLLDKESIKGITTLVDGFLDLLVVITAILDTLDPLLEGISTISSAFGGVGESDLGAAGAADTGNIGNILSSVTEPVSQSPYTTGSAQTGNTTASGNPMQVNIAVEGDTGVVKNVSAEVAQQEVQAQSDRAQRNAGTGGP